MCDVVINILFPKLITPHPPIEDPYWNTTLSLSTIRSLIAIVFDLLLQDAPFNKLLFAKDVPRYRKMVQRYYQDIQLLPASNSEQLAAEYKKTCQVGIPFTFIYLFYLHF